MHAWGRQWPGTGSLKDRLLDQHTPYVVSPTAWTQVTGTFEGSLFHLQEVLSLEFKNVDSLIQNVLPLTSTFKS